MAMYSVTLTWKGDIVNGVVKHEWRKVNVAAVNMEEAVHHVSAYVRKVTNNPTLRFSHEATLL